MEASFFKQGNVVDYVAGSALDCGDIVFIGKTAGVLTRDTANGGIGSVSIKGVYQIAKGTGALTVGTAVYWDSDNSKVTTTANAYYLGVVVVAAASGDSTVQVLLNAPVPYAVQASPSDAAPVTTGITDTVAATAITALATSINGLIDKLEAAGVFKAAN